jgi:small subunit ribosomal protein S18
MARNTDRSTGNSNRRNVKDAARRTKKKPCALCRDKVEWVDYKDTGLLRKYMSDRGKIRARRVSGNCTQHQRDVAIAIKTARELALLPYTQRMVTERSAGRGRGGRGRGGPGEEGAGREGGGRGAPRGVPAAAVDAYGDDMVPVEEVEA